MTDDNKKTGFNWLGFLFAPYYFAGYGKLGKGILMAILGLMPLTLLFVDVYGGFKANKELPVKQVNFSWGKAIAVLVLHLAIMNAFVFAIKGHI